MSYYIEIKNGKYDAAEWIEISEKFTQILPMLGQKICGPNGRGKPKITTKSIRFNGDGFCNDGVSKCGFGHKFGKKYISGDSCATRKPFVVKKSGSHALINASYRPYKSAFMALALITKQVAPAKTTIFHEYSMDDWSDVLVICRNMFGINVRKTCRELEIDNAGLE